METENTTAKNVAELNWKEIMIIFSLLAVANFAGIWLAQKLT